MSTLVRPRKPLLALMMSLFLPGFGQLYNGEPNRAIWLFLGYCGLTAVGAAFVALYVPSGLTMAVLLVGLCLTVGLWIYGMVDAWKAAKRQPDFMPRAWQTSGLYLLVAIVCVFIAQPVFSSYIRDHEVESFRDPSSSMEPTLMRGDFIFADKRYNCPNCKEAVERGDIAIFTYPNDRTVYYVKRIVGLPGERVQIKGYDVLINGRSLGIGASQTSDGQQVVEGDGHRQWRVIWSKRDEPSADIDTTVPAGQVFVLGDNRNLSVDSRSIGTVPLQDVVGRVRQVWFSYADGRVRWARMGRVIA
jgi:signal peptidase I